MDVAGVRFEVLGLLQAGVCLQKETGSVIAAMQGYAASPEKMWLYYKPLRFLAGKRFSVRMKREPGENPGQYPLL